MSDAQQPEQGEQSEELGDVPKTGDGATKLSFEASKIKQYNAQDILNNPTLNELWMRQVEPGLIPFNGQMVYFLPAD